MAELYVKAPDGRVVVIDDSQAQAAADQGYQPVDQATIQAAQASVRQRGGDQAALDAGQGLVGEAGATYNAPQAFAEKALSSATFGLAPRLDTPEAVAGARRLAAEHPYAAFGAEVVGQLPLAYGLGGLGEATVAGARAAGYGRAAMAGVRAADFGAQALVGGAQTEAEASRVAQDEFSWTDAAVAGVAGEAIGRGAALGFSSALGASRNLLRRGVQETVSADAASSLAKGGVLNDFRIAHHADQYHNELATLAADDLDSFERNFAEVSRQDRKRARITRVIQGDAGVQQAIRAEAQAGLAELYDALSVELADAPGPAKSLLRQLDDRMDALAAADGGGKRLWRLLDENRQALQDYAKDLHAAYETQPGSAWLSREGLARLDAAEKATREALLREDAWGAEAAREQAAYNVPFNEKYFPAEKTVRAKLMQTTAYDARGFPVWRGDPGKVLAFFRRGADDVDAARLAEQFGQFLDGAEAIARAGERDTPRAARDTLESIRRLRKAMANAEYVSAAAERSGVRAGVAQVGIEALGAAGGVALGGPVGGVATFAALRGARAGDFLFRAGQKLGWGAGKAESMARLLERDALPVVRDADRPLVDDLADAGTGPSGPPSAPPSGGGGPAPGPGGPRGGLTPSELAEAGRASWTPSGPAGAGATAADDLADGADVLAEPTTRRSGRAERAVRETVPVVRGEEGLRRQDVRLQVDLLREAGVAQRREAARLKELARNEFRQVVAAVRESGAPEAKSMADDLVQHEDELVQELVDEAAPSSGPRPSAAARAATTEPPPPGGYAAPSGKSLRAQDVLFAIRERPGVTAAELREDLGLSREEFGPAFMELREAGQVELREGQAFPAGKPATAAASEAAQATTKAFADQGIEVSMGAQRLPETLDFVFGEGRAPTPEQWRQVIPLEVLGEIAPVAQAKVDVLGDALIWRANGESSVAGPHRTPAGLDDPGGYQDQTWSISRTFTRTDDGRLEVHHDHFMVRGDLQGSGAGAKALAEMFRAYRKIGVDLVTVDSVEVGKYFWPSIGFDCSPASLRLAKRAYGEWLRATHGAGVADAAAKQVDAVRSLPSLAQLEYGKEFLLSQTGNWNFGLRLELKDSNPLFHLMRNRLDVAAAAVAGLGTALEGARQPSPGEEHEARQASAEGGPAGAAFLATAGLLRQGRGRLVRDVAKRLFTATAGPLVRTTARLAYSRAQMDARREEIQAWQASPQELVDRVAEGLRDAPPNAFAKTAQGVFAAAAFLREKLPLSPGAAPVALRGAPVSVEALAKYGRYEQAALRPGDAWREAAESGFVSPELLETTQELYPDLLAELRVEAYQAVRAGGPPLSIQAKVQYAKLFDGDGAIADPAFSTTAVQMVNAAYEQQARVAPPKPSSAGVSQTAAAVQSPRPWAPA
jgi:hypothetical protein